MWDRLKEFVKKVGPFIARELVKKFMRRAFNEKSPMAPAENYYEKIRELERNLEDCRARNRLLESRLEEMGNRLNIYRVWSLVATIMAAVLLVILLMR